MKPRAHLSEKERRCRSRLAQTVHELQLIAGSITTTSQTCGKPNCRCRRGEKHMAVYVALKHKGKRRMYSVPLEAREQVSAAVQTYKRLREDLQTLSEICCERLLNKGG